MADIISQPATAGQKFVNLHPSREIIQKELGMWHFEAEDSRTLATGHMTIVLDRMERLSEMAVKGPFFKWYLFQ